LYAFKTKHKKYVKYYDKTSFVGLLTTESLSQPAGENLYFITFTSLQY